MKQKVHITYMPITLVLVEEKIFKPPIEPNTKPIKKQLIVRYCIKIQINGY